jgi:hypothetical protein
VPPPVAGAPAGRCAFVPVPVADPVGKGLSLVVAVAVSVPDAVGELLLPVLVGEAEHEAVADALALAEAEADGDALVVVQLEVGDGLQEGDALAEADDEALALELADAEALAEGQLDVDAAATPLNGPVNTTTATEASRVAAPVARPTSPALWSFSQLSCRD